MSAKSISLNSKPVIAVVLALLAVVAVINVAVFKPGKRSSRRAEVRVQSAQPLPVDLSEFLTDSAPPRENMAAWADAATPTLQRDPFGGSRKVVAAVEPEEAASDEEVIVIQPLACEAVLLGGANPVAVINGQSYRVGETVREYQVAAVGALGVKLTHHSQADRFLSVHSGRGPSGSSRIVNGSQKTRGLNQTSLVEHARGERK